MSTFRFVAQSAPIGLSAESAPIRIRVAGAQGPAGPAGPNSVTSATTSDGTAELEISSLEVVGEGVALTGIYSSFATVGEYGTISTNGESASISTIGNEAGISTNGENASIVTQGTNAMIRTQGSNASIYTEGDGASIFTAGQNAYMQSGSFRLYDGSYTTELTHAPTDDRAIAFPDASGTIALTSDITNSVTSATTSDGTAELEVASLEAVDGISTSGVSGTISTSGSDGFIFTSGETASISTTGDFAAISTSGTNAGIYTVGSVASISTSGESAHIYTDNATAYIQTRSTFRLFDGEYATTLSHAPTDDRAIAFPDASGTVALTEDYTDGTAIIDVLDATVQGTLTADHIHGNLAGSVYAHIRAGENLAKGDPVYISGSHGSGANLIAIVSKADASNAAKMPAVGVMDAAVANNANGHMVITGTITELNTNAFAVNTVLYVATGGGWTSTPPAANSQAVAIVERSNTNNGAVIVKVNGLASTPIDPVRTTVTGNGATSVYAIGGATGLTNPSALIVAIDGVLQEPNADYTVSGGNITFTDPLANGAKAVIVSPTNTIQVGQVTPSDGSVTSAKIVAGVTLTSPSIAGTAAFTSTTRPTSAGTGTPAAASLITRADGDARYFLTFIRGTYRWSNTSSTYSASHVSGGSSGTNTDVIDLSTSATAGSISFLRSNVFNIRPWQVVNGSTRGVVDWSRRTVHSVKINTGIITGADTVARILLGQSLNNTTAQDFSSSDRGIGFRIVNGLISAHVANGSTVTTSSTGITVGNSTDSDIVIESDGAGNWNAYVNGTLTNSGTGAPTGTSTAGNNALCLSLTNGTTAAVRQIYIVQQTTMQF